MAVVALLDHGKLMMEEAGGTKAKVVAFVPGALVVKVGSGLKCLVCFALPESSYLKI